MNLDALAKILADCIAEDVVSTKRDRKVTDALCAWISQCKALAPKEVFGTPFLDYAKYMTDTDPSWRTPMQPAQAEAMHAAAKAVQRHISVVMMRSMSCMEQPLAQSKRQWLANAIVEVIFDSENSVCGNSWIADPKVKSAYPALLADNPPLMYACMVIIGNIDSVQIARLAEATSS
jgi:hypothetical protein